MVFLEVIPTEDGISRHFVNVNNITNVICTTNKIIVYTDDGFKGKVIKRYTTEEERDTYLDKLNTLLGFYDLK